MNGRTKLILVSFIALALGVSMFAGTTTGVFTNWWGTIESFLDDPELKSVYTSGLVGLGAYKWGMGGGMPAAAPYLTIAVIANQLTNIVSVLVTATI
jgi:hypothetical protein